MAIAACATQPTAESGLSSHQQSTIDADYPSTRFLTAQGQGDSTQEAGDNAGLNLARIFSVRITGEQQSFRQVNSTQTEAGESVQVSYTLNNRVAQQTDQLIEGMEVVFSYDNLEKVHTALAVLEKTPAADRLRQQIEQLDEQTHDVFQLQPADALHLMANSYRAWQLQLLANSRRRQLAIVQAAVVAPSAWQTQKLRRNVISQLKQISFKTQIENVTNNTRQLVFSALAQAGIEKIEQPQADYQMTITVHIEEPFQRDNWLWQTATLRFDIGDSTSNRERGGWLWNMKVSATDKSLIEGRMNKAIQEKVENDTLGELLQLANKTLPEQL